MNEFYISVIGNVDSSKSTTIGYLTNPGMFDDGNGSLRSLVCKHPHEKESGRTSDISQRYIKYPDRIINFIDLCGHEKYLRTTINGLSSIYPDLSIVCISDKITRMTKEHLGICITMNIPILILFTKIDIIPPQITQGLIRELKHMLGYKKMFEIKNNQDLLLSNNFIPFIKTSNKTGNGMNLLVDFLKNIPKRLFSKKEGVFTVDHIYNISGYGTVLSGYNNISNVEVGDSLYLGSFENGNFIEVKVRSIHDDYKKFVDKLTPGLRGCLCIKSRYLKNKNIRPGMILSKTIQQVHKSFTARVKIFHHQTSIKPGYQAFANIGSISEPIILKTIKNKNGDVIRSGEEALVTFDFLKNYNYVEIGQYLIFRENLTRGIGTILQLH